MPQPGSFSKKFICVLLWHIQLPHENISSKNTLNLRNNDKPIDKFYFTMGEGLSLYNLNRFSC